MGQALNSLGMVTTFCHFLKILTPGIVVSIEPLGWHRFDTVEINQLANKRYLCDFKEYLRSSH